MNRRTFLTAASAVAVAGCGGSEYEEPPDQNLNQGDGADRNTPEPEPTATPIPGTTSKHPAVKFLDATDYSETYSYGVKGTVKNVGDRVLDYVEVQVYYYDSTEARIGEGLDNTSDLSVGGRWRFKAPYIGSDEEAIEYWVAVGDATVY